MTRTPAILAIWALIGGLGLSSLHAVTIHKPAFTIKLPEGWVEMPPNVLAAMQENLQRKAPNAAIPRYDYGFQPRAQKWLAYPYLLVQIAETGKIEEKNLRALRRMNINKALEKQAGDFAAVMSNAVLGEMQYDEDANVVWVASQSEVVGAGKILGISGLIPTEKGALQFHGYSTEATFYNYLPVFRQIVTTAVPSPELAYRPQAAAKSPSAATTKWLEVAGKILVGLIIAGIVAFVAGVGRKPKDALQKKAAAKAAPGAKRS